MLTDWAQFIKQLIQSFKSFSHSSPCNPAVQFSPDADILSKMQTHRFKLTVPKPMESLHQMPVACARVRRPTGYKSEGSCKSLRFINVL